MNKFIKALVVIAVICSIVAQDLDVSDQDAALFTEFQNFITTNKKNYASISEMKARFNIFKYNVNNVRSNVDGVTFSQGINKFSDLTKNEFKQKYAGLRVSLAEKLKAQKNGVNLQGSDQPNLTAAAPASWDWRNEGAVTSVREQGECGCCWAFSAVAAMEGQYAIKKGKSVAFSEQQLLDCDSSNTGCNGGNMGQAFDYVRKAGGIVSNKGYPYKERQGSCKFNSSNAVGKVTGSITVNTNEETIKNKLYSHGPLAVAINSSKLQSYTGGIVDLSASKCNPDGIDHGVTLVGYGVESGRKYWIVKNSWGADWGEEGFFRIARGKGTCGINTYVVAPKM